MQRFGVIPPPNQDHIRHILGTPVQTPIHKEGVKVFGLYYQSLKLQDARRRIGQKQVLVRVDPLDIGHVSVKIDREWIVVPCTVEGFDGKSLAAWQAAQADLRRKNASIAGLSAETVHRAMADIEAAADGAREEACVPKPVMTSERMVAFDRQLSAGFSMVRAKNGPTSIVPADDLAGPTEPALTWSSTPVTQDFFTE